MLNRYGTCAFRVSCSSRVEVRLLNLPSSTHKVDKFQDTTTSSYHKYCICGSFARCDTPWSVPCSLSHTCQVCHALEVSLHKTDMVRGTQPLSNLPKLPVHDYVRLGLLLPGYRYALEIYAISRTLPKGLVWPYQLEHLVAGGSSVVVPLCDAHLEWRVSR